MRSTSMSSRALPERGLHREAWWGQHREALGRALASAPEVFYSLPMLPVKQFRHSPLHQRSYIRSPCSLSSNSRCSSRAS